MWWACIKPSHQKLCLYEKIIIFSYSIRVGSTWHRFNLPFTCLMFQHYSLFATPHLSRMLCDSYLFMLDKCENECIKEKGFTEKEEKRPRFGNEEIFYANMSLSWFVMVACFLCNTAASFGILFFLVFYRNVKSLHTKKLIRKW